MMLGPEAIRDLLAEASRRRTVLGRAATRAAYEARRRARRAAAREALRVERTLAGIEARLVILVRRELAKPIRRAKWNERQRARRAAMDLTVLRERNRLDQQRKRARDRAAKEAA